MTFKRFETFVIIVIIGIFGAVFAIVQSSSDAKKVSTNQNQTTGSVTNRTGIPQLVESSVVRYYGEDGRNALELLRVTNKVETQSFGDLGEFVNSINDVKADSQHFWAFYIDGVMGQVGADAYQTKSSEVIEWKLEEIK